MSIKRKKAVYFWLAVFLLGVLTYAFFGTIMTSIGDLLVVSDEPKRSDVVVVLNTGVELYPRLWEAAALYQEGFAAKVVINGNRKTHVLRRLEKMGYQPCCPWYENRVRILELLGVPRKDIITISAEDVYDTVSEAKAVGDALISEGFSSLIITTSKSHTRRAHNIWKSIFKNQFRIHTVAARHDPFSPQGWWREGRQIRWVLAEYGAWIFSFWKTKGVKPEQK